MPLLLFRSHGVTTAVATISGSGALVAGSVGVTKLTIDGVEWIAHIGTIQIREVLNGPNTFECEIDSLSGARPLRGKELVFIDSGQLAFDGIVDEVDESAFTDGFDTMLKLRIRALDNNTLMRRRFVTLTIPSKHLKDALIDLAPYYTPYGVSLDSLQVGGPLLPTITFEDRRLDDALNDLCSQASEVGGNSSGTFSWKVNYFKQLRLSLPDELPAPFNVSDGDQYVKGNIDVDPLTSQDTANYVIMKIGEGVRSITDNFVGDGTTSIYTLTAPAAQMWVVTRNGNIYETISVAGIGFDLAATWLYYQNDHTIHRVQAGDIGGGVLGPVPNPPGIGDTISINYMGSFPVRIAVDGGAAPGNRVEMVIERSDVFDPLLGQALANQALEKVQTNARPVHYRTFEKGLHPGQSQIITSARRDLSGPFLLTEVLRKHWEGTVYFHEVTAIPGSIYTGSWRDDMRSWGPSGGGSVASGVVTAITPTQSHMQYFLGGSSTLFVQSATPTWVASDAVRIVIDTTVVGTAAGRVFVRLRATSGSVSARLFNITDNVAAGSSTVVSSSTWTDLTFDVAFVAGSKTYELQVLPTLPNVDVAAVGYLMI